MLEIVLWGIVFIVSLGVLLKASDYFTDSAEKIGLFFKLPAFVIGVTIVALGTSLPELVSSVFAVLKGSSEIVAGNVVGSNITNICLILGITALITTRSKFNHNIINVDLPILLGSTFLTGMMMIDGKFTFSEGILSLLGLSVFLFHTITSNRGTKKDKDQMKKEISIDSMKIKNKKFPFNNLAILGISSIFIFLGAKYTIDSVIYISEVINIGKDIIAASVVALGTSLPELAVSYTAARKGNIEVAVGNILGSNIFNSLAVMGFAALIGTLIIPQNILFFGLPMMLISTFMYIFITQDREIDKWEGSFLLVFYVFYIGKLFGWI